MEIGLVNFVCSVVYDPLKYLFLFVVRHCIADQRLFDDRNILDGGWS